MQAVGGGGGGGGGGVTVVVVVVMPTVAMVGVMSRSSASGVKHLGSIELEFRHRQRRRRGGRAEGKE